MDQEDPLEEKMATHSNIIAQKAPRTGDPGGIHSMELQSQTQLIGFHSVSLSVASDSLWPRDCSPPGYSVHWVSQARILEWVAIPFSGGSSQPRD